MFETLRKQGSYRIDYLNQAARGSPEAFAFYVRGELEQGAPYSVSAKRHLRAGLNIIRKNMNCDFLVAIYLDINTAQNLHRPAYLQMKQDLHAGYFHRVFTLHAADLIGDNAVMEDLIKLSQDISGLDVFTYQEGRLHRESL